MALQAGAARVDITPRLGGHLDGNVADRVSTNIHDQLYAQAIVLDNGETRLGIVVCDLIVVLHDMADEVKRLVADQAGIAPENLLVTGTHTHYAPAVFGAFLTEPEPEYAASVPARIADAVALAARRLQPAQLGWAFTACPTEVHNRRWHLTDGTVRMNPGLGNPLLDRPAGPTDPTLSVMVLRTPARQPIAVLANLGLHYVGSANGDVSPDYFGAFGRALQRCAGAEFVAVMSNGCFGDINNIDYSRPSRQAPDAYHHCERVANVCAGAAWKAWNTLWESDFQDDVPLAAALELVELIPRRPTATQLAEARAYLAAHQPEENLMAWAYAREHLLMEHGPQRLELPLQALRLGETGLIGLPGEVFAEIGLEIKARSPFAQTVTVGLANDSVGYVAPDHQLEWGGYECTLCRHVVAPKGTAQKWTATAVRLLEQVAGAPVAAQG